MAQALMQSLRNNIAAVITVVVCLAGLAVQFRYGPDLIDPDNQHNAASERSRMNHDRAEAEAAAHAEKLRETQGKLTPGWVFGEGWSKLGEVAPPVPGVDI